jgi:hypothetical protein
MDEFEEAYQAVVSHPDFKRIEEKALAQGFRKATARELRDAFNCEQWARDVVCAYGTTWVKCQ